MKFAKRVFLIAGLYGLVALTPMYFLETRIALESPPAITHPEFFYGFIGVGLAWQIVFLLIAANPLRYRPVMLAGIAEKLGFGVATLALFLQGRLATPTFMLTSLDWVFALLFLIAYLKTPAEPSR